MYLYMPGFWGIYFEGLCILLALLISWQREIYQTYLVDFIEPITEKLTGSFSNWAIVNAQVLQNLTIS